MKNPTTNMNRLLSAFRQSLTEQTLLKLTLSKPTPAAADLKNVYARLVLLKTGVKVQFTLRYKFRDITKNLDENEAVAALAEWLATDFEIANLHTPSQIMSLEQKQGKNLKFSVSENKNKDKNAENQAKIAAIQPNDHQKQRRLTPEDSIWLHRLGITNREGVVLKEKQSKYKQIDKYLEIIDSLLNDFIQKTATTTKKPLRIADMGAGKGYLTFALYDFLCKNAVFSPEVIGVETRPELITVCNSIAEESGFAQLRFVESTIADYDAEATNMLIALHACDTATDDAIAKGIAAKADIIVVAPCCHKQVRRAMQPTGAMQTLLQNGIHTERQAELITDSVRALLLQAEGYTVKVQEFISLEHTGKNILITAVKHAKKVDKIGIYSEINKILAGFGIKNHYLMEIL